MTLPSFAQYFHKYIFIYCLGFFVLKRRNCGLHKEGFSLIEVLTVIAVMVILSGIVLPSLRMARIRAFEAKTEAQLVSLSLALKLYKNDMGTFPSHLDAWSLMYGTEREKEISLGSRWRGPYIEVKTQKDLSSKGDFLDAWGKKFNYVLYASLRNGRFFDIFSLGRDGVSKTKDDIHLWKIS